MHSRAKPSGADSTPTTSQATSSQTPAPQPAHNNVLPLEGPARAAAHREPRSRSTRPSPGLHLQPQQPQLPPSDSHSPAPGLQLQQLLGKYPLPARTTPSRKGANPAPNPGPSSPSSSGRAPAAYATPHDPLGTRFWEARLLSRSCTSLAFHIASHFHVPSAATDHLVHVLTAPAPYNPPTAQQHAPLHTPSPSPSASAPLPLHPGTAPAPAPTSHTSTASDPLSSLLSDLAALSASPLPPAPPFSPDADLYGNLPVIHSLKAVAAALVDYSLWRDTPSIPSTSTRATPSSLVPLEAPPALNALAHAAAGAVLRLSHACGHEGAYTLREPPLPPSLSPTLSSSSPFPSLLPLDPPSASSSARVLPGIPYSGRQLGRLLDMAATSDPVKLAALAALPASTAAALLFLLAAAQPHTPPSLPPPSSAIPGALAMAGPLLPNTLPGSGSGSRIPAALLARYLRVGGRSHSPLDTVRVMWALLRLQLPGAGALQLPLDPGAILRGAAGGVGGAGGEGRGAGGEMRLMERLGEVLLRQLRNRERCEGALRKCGPGEVYGVWQLAVVALVLLRQREAQLGAGEEEGSGSSSSSGSGDGGAKVEGQAAETGRGSSGGGSGSSSSSSAVVALEVGRSMALSKGLLTADFALSLAVFYAPSTPGWNAPVR